MDNNIESRVEIIAKIIEEVSGIPRDKINKDSAFLDDLDLSSLELMSIVAEIEHTFSVSIPEKELVSLETVIELAELIGQKTEAQGK